MTTVHLLIKGKVQGVFYRASAKDKALALQLKGWIKNTAEGNVEAIVCGSTEAVYQFVDWCKTGPPMALVSDVEINLVPQQSFTGFQIVKGL